MSSYTNEYSQFPNAIMEKQEFKNVTDSQAELINQIKKYQESGNYTAAATLLARNPELKDYMPGVDFYNMIIEEQRNTEIYAKTIKQSMYFDSEEPEAVVDGDAWIGGE